MKYNTDGVIRGINKTFPHTMLYFTYTTIRRHNMTYLDNIVLLFS